MKTNDVQYFLKQLGCEKINPSGDWVSSTCPFARWQHRSGRDSHPSFSVAIDDTNISGARCHACHFRGSLLELLFKFQDLSGRNMDELADFVRANNGPSLGSMINGIKKKRAVEAAAPPSKPSEPYDWDREVAGIKGVQVDWLAKLGDAKDLPTLAPDALNKFKPCTGDVLDYLTGEGEAYYDELNFGLKRRLSSEMLKDWEVCWDKSFKKIIIPIRDCKQRLVGYSQRAFVEKGSKALKYMHTKGFRRDFYLYGEQFWTEGGTGYVVEGFFDAMRLRAYGYKVGAVMGTHLSDFQIEKCVRYFENMVVVPDGDPPGYDASRVWFEKLSVRLPTRVVRTPEGWDPDDFTLSDARRLLGEPT